MPRIEEGPTEDYTDDYEELLEAQRLIGEISEAKSQLKQLRQALDERIMKRYETLTEDEIRYLLVDQEMVFRSLRRHRRKIRISHLGLCKQSERACRPLRKHATRANRRGFWP